MLVGFFIFVELLHINYHNKELMNCDEHVNNEQLY